MNHLAVRPLPLALACLLWTSLSGHADDWPQWRGPLRDGVWREDGVLERFPPAGPPVRWRKPIGAGFSGPAVAGPQGNYGVRFDSSGPAAEHPHRQNQAGNPLPVRLPLACSRCLVLGGPTVPISLTPAEQDFQITGTSQR
jgi:hypothetical protein